MYVHTYNVYTYVKQKGEMNIHILNLHTHIYVCTVYVHTYVYPLLQCKLKELPLFGS